MKTHKTHLFGWVFVFLALAIGSSLTAQRHEFSPSVVAMAERILITVWIMIFQVSLFFIIVKRPPLPPLGHLPLYGENSC